MNYEEAMSTAEKGGTTRRNKRKPVYRLVTWGIGGGLLVLALILLPSGPLQTYARWSKERQANSSVRDPQATQHADTAIEGVVHALPTVPAFGDSERIVPPVPYTTNFGGSAGFTIHCVYRNDGIGRDNDKSAPCPSGDMAYVYVHNNTQFALDDIKYWFERHR